MFRAPLCRLRPPPGLAHAHRPIPRTAHRTLFTGAGSSSRSGGTWRGTALRWGAALGAVYWYNTSPLFADDVAPLVGPPPPAFDEDEKTVDAVIAEKRREIERRTREREEREAAAAKKAEAEEQKKSADKDKPEPQEHKDDKPAPAEQNPHDAAEAATDPAALESEADQQGAFNSETGEINWDCPCLGGMAHGPCGEEFRAAFSCFVYSKEEPKGMECIDKFEAMRDCFRKHPDVYGEFEDDDAQEGSERKDAPEQQDALEQQDVPQKNAPQQTDAPQQKHAPDPKVGADMDTAIELDSPLRSSGKTGTPAEQHAKAKKKAEEAEEAAKSS